MVNYSKHTSSVTPNTKKGFDVTKFHKFMITQDILNYAFNNDFFESKKNFLNKEKRRNENKYEKHVKNDNNVTTENQSRIWTPNERDTLFWCFYIMVKGIDTYKQMINRNIVVEKQLKIEYIDKFRENKTLVKTHRLGPLSHIENMLLNESCIDMKTFQALCILDNVSCVFTFGKCYHEINIDKDDEVGDDISNIHTIVSDSAINERKKYSYRSNTTLDSINLVRNTMFYVDNLSKPVKAMTSYKLEELIDMCNRLQIEIEPKLKKKELYERIVQCMNS